MKPTNPSSLKIQLRDLKFEIQFDRNRRDVFECSSVRVFEQGLGACVGRSRH